MHWPPFAFSFVQQKMNKQSRWWRVYSRKLESSPRCKLGTHRQIDIDWDPSYIVLTRWLLEECWVECERFVGAKPSPHSQKGPKQHIWSAVKFTKILFWRRHNTPCWQNSVSHTRHTLVLHSSLADGRPLSSTSRDSPESTAGGRCSAHGISGTNIKTFAWHRQPFR